MFVTLEIYCAETWQAIHQPEAQDQLAQRPFARLVQAIRAVKAVNQGCLASTAAAKRAKLSCAGRNITQPSGRVPNRGTSKQV